MDNERACVDCKRCVVVCPTGIDIRGGTQMECVACTACIDACDDIMVKLGRAPGLVRYDSQDGLAGKARRVLRPRVVLYTVLLAAGVLAATIATRRRSDFEVGLLRLPGEPYTLEAGVVRNALQLHLVNKRSAGATYRIEVEPAAGMSVVLPTPTVTLASLSGTRVPLFLSVAREQFRTGFPVVVRVERTDDPRDALQVTGTFLGPGSAWREPGARGSAPSGSSP